MADGFAAGVRNGDEHKVGRVRSGNGVGFDDTNPGFGFDGSEIAGGGLRFVRCGSVSDSSDHGGDGNVPGLGRLACAGFEIVHLLNDVGGGKAGEAGIFGFALAIGEMAEGASVDIGLATKSNDGGHGRMVGGVPVGDVEVVLGLLVGERCGTVGDVTGSRVGRRSIGIGGRIEDVGPVRDGLCVGMGGGEREERERRENCRECDSKDAAGAGHEVSDLRCEQEYNGCDGNHSGDERDSGEDAGLKLSATAASYGCQRCDEVRGQ